MCGSMVDIQSSTAEIRRGRKKKKDRKKKPQDENRMSASATQGGHNQTIMERENDIQACNKRVHGANKLGNH